jgi:hypothetical protein
MAGVSGELGGDAVESLSAAASGPNLGCGNVAPGWLLLFANGERLLQETAARS